MEGNKTEVKEIILQDIKKQLDRQDRKLDLLLDGLELIVSNEAYLLLHAEGDAGRLGARANMSFLELLREQRKGNDWDEAGKSVEEILKMLFR